MENSSLRQQLALLYELQERDQVLLSIHERLQDIPRYIKELEAGVVKYKKDIETVTAALAECEKLQRSKSAEIEMSAVQREKYRTEQREVTSNEAYTALENQIDFLDEKEAEAEDYILVSMEESDRLKTELEKLEAEAAKVDTANAEKKAVLEEEYKTIEAEMADKLDARKAFLSQIYQPIRAQYHRWIKRQETDFVALSRKGVCGSCRIKIQPQTLKEAQKYEKFVHCSSCRKVLYVQPLSPDIPFP